MMKGRAAFRGDVTFSSAMSQSRQLLPCSLSNIVHLLCAANMFFLTTPSLLHQRGNYHYSREEPTHEEAQVPGLAPGWGPPL